MNGVVTLIRERWTAAPARARTALSWAGFVVLGWVLLRPVLVTTISGDDFLNPFYVFDDYGPSPFGMFRKVSVDLTRAGHFNHLGQNIGAIAYVVWAYLIGWGLRYSLVYAVTKLAVLLLAALAAARLLRRMAGLGGRELGVWRSRFAIATALFATLQIHVAWSSDPVASFPLSGYASVAIGLLALDLGIDALWRDDRRSLVIAAIGLCVAIQYYEINVALLPALAPLLWLRWRAADAAVRLRSLLIRAGLLVLPAILMTLVLQAVASRANRGYTGTDVAVGSGTGTVLVRSIAGSLPGAAWRQADRWLAQGFDITATGLLIGVAGAIAVVALAWRRGRASDAPYTTAAAPAAWRTVLVLATSPLLLWLAATVIQATTAKVRAETLAVGYVYNYYAYGSVGVVLIGALVVPRLVGSVPRSARSAVAVALVAIASLFAVAQAVVNDNVQRVFAERLAINDDLLAAISDRPPVEERCATLDAWLAFPFFQDYYRTDMVDGVEALYEHAHDESFCPAG